MQAGNINVGRGSNLALVMRSLDSHERVVLASGRDLGLHVASSERISVFYVAIRV